jgi:hypothetical protein
MSDVNASLGKGLSIVVITPSTDASWLNSLALIRHRSSAPAVILLDQASFGGSRSARPLAEQLAAAGLVVHTVEKGQAFRSINIEKKDWEEQRRGRIGQSLTPARV